MKILELLFALSVVLVAFKLVCAPWLPWWLTLLPAGMALLILAGLVLLVGVALYITRSDREDSGI